MYMRTAWVPALLALAGPLAAQEQPAPIVRGFISSSAFVQSGAFGFGNGQNAQWARAADDGHVLGADVRNTRVAMQLPNAAIAGGVRAGGLIELDFFGGFNGAGALSDEQPLPRLRSAYADIVVGRTTVRAGQAFTPIFGNVPVSVTHLAFPLGYGAAGVIGFRSPGLFVLHDLTAREAPLRLGVQLGAFRGSWTGAGDLTDHGSAGEAAYVPQLEARLDLAGGSPAATRWSAYVAGHYDEKRLVADDGAATLLPGRAWTTGARLEHGRMTLHGSAYNGRAVAQQMGQLVQFGDIGGGGGWLQAGVRAGSGWSFWAFAGQDDPSDEDVLAHVAGDGRLRNRIGALSAQVSAGDYTAGVQWLRASTEWGRATGQEHVTWNRQADQLSLSVLFRFSTERRVTPVARSN